MLEFQTVAEDVLLTYLYMVNVNAICSTCLLKQTEKKNKTNKQTNQC